MTTPLEKTLKRELTIQGRTYVVAISPDGIKLTLKGHRKGLELQWESLVSGEAALATALNASIGKFTADDDAPKSTRAKPTPKKTARGRKVQA